MGLPNAESASNIGKFFKVLGGLVKKGKSASEEAKNARAARKAADDAAYAEKMATARGEEFQPGLFPEMPSVTDPVKKKYVRNLLWNNRGPLGKTVTGLTAGGAVGTGLYGLGSTINTMVNPAYDPKSLPLIDPNASVDNIYNMQLEDINSRYAAAADAAKKQQQLYAALGYAQQAGMEDVSNKMNADLPGSMSDAQYNADTSSLIGDTATATDRLYTSDTGSGVSGMKPVTGTSNTASTDIRDLGNIQQKLGQDDRYIGKVGANSDQQYYNELGQALPESISKMAAVEAWKQQAAEKAAMNEEIRALNLEKAKSKISSRSAAPVTITKPEIQAFSYEYNVLKARGAVDQWLAGKFNSVAEYEYYLKMAGGDQRKLYILLRSGQI